MTKPISGWLTLRAIMWFGAESGFFSDSFLSAIEQTGLGYLVKVKLKNLKTLFTRQDWQLVPGELATEYCTFTHQCAGWDRSREFIGVRILQ